MDLNKVIELIINSYGIGGLIISILIILFAISVPYLFKKNSKDIKDTMALGFKDLTKDLTSAIQEENKELIKGMNDNQSKLIETQHQMFKELLDNKNREHAKNLSTRDTIAIPIQNKINHLKDFYKATRVCVFEFHNSLVNLNGLPFKWYDVIYESIARGVHPVSGETKNMPSNILTPIISQITEGEIALFNKDNIESFYDQSSVLYDFCIRKKINDLIVAPLINKDNELFGVLTLEFADHNYLTKKNLILDDVELEAHAISTLLELKHSEENNKEEK